MAAMQGVRQLDGQGGRQVAPQANEFMKREESHQETRK